MCAHAAKDLCTITEGHDGGQYGFFIHPGEAVSLPFKFQSFRSFVSSDAEFDTSDSGEQQMEKRLIKVSVGVWCWCDKRLIGFQDYLKDFTKSTIRAT